jgi:hypothetical protein
VDIPFPTPAKPDLVLDGSGADGDAAALASRILRRIGSPP